MTIPSTYVLSSPSDGSAWYQHAMQKGDDSNYILVSNQQGWVNDTNVYISTFVPNTSHSDDKFYFPVNTDLFDYYVVANIAVDDITSRISIDDFDVGNITGSSPNFVFVSSGILTDKKTFYSDYQGNYTNTFGIQNIACTAKLNIDFVGDLHLGMFAFLGCDGFLYNAEKIFSLSVIVSNKGYEDAYNDIVASINNQTDVLGGYINNGNSSTGGIVSGNNSAIDNLDDVVSEYHATEQQFFDDFNSNQQAIASDIVGWSWGGLVSCANWVGETMTDYYNNMGDFRQYIIYPLMLGIALFFLGRGSSIIGHLYRKPTTTFTHTESRSTLSNGVRHTNTVTTRNGGVFRK